MPRVLCALSAALLLLSAAPARACVTAAEAPRLIGEPEDDDVGVPTDVVLHYALPDGLGDVAPDAAPGEFTLRAEGGGTVPLRSTRSEIYRLELTPERPLQPNTTYTLQARWLLVNGVEARAELSFETGDGPYEGTPEPPTALLRSYELPHGYYNSCGPERTGTCIFVANDQSWVEHTLIDEEGRMEPPTLLQGTVLTDLSGIVSHNGFRCVDLRTRAANGVRSQPLRLCGKDAPIQNLTGLDIQVQLQCSARGMEWCDAVGTGGSEPGLPNAEPDQPALSCYIRSPTPQTSGPSSAGSGAAGTPSQSTTAVAAAGAGGEPQAQPAAAGMEAPTPVAGASAEVTPAPTTLGNSDAGAQSAPPPAAPSCSTQAPRPSSALGSVCLILAALAVARRRSRMR